jgi:two-component system, sensor histidine kinase and response regulator
MKQKILIIDDSPMNLSVLEDSLANLDYELFFAKNPQSGIEVAKEIRPDLALLDIMMPSMGGFEVLKNLKEIKGLEQLPVIFLTALNDDETKIKAFEVGVVDYIAKPFNAREVAVRVKTHLELARLTKSLDFLLKMAAHEFIIPLSIIDTSLQMQKMDHGETMYTANISSASTTLQGVYKNIAYFLSSYTKQLEPKLLNLSEFVKNRVEYLKVLADAYNNSFEIEIGDDVSIVFNESELERVVDNILSNATKHSVDASLIKVRVSKDESGVFFEVENRCRRIENMSRLFEEFYKGSDDVKGLGLGLYLVLRICETNGAKIVARNEGDSVFFRVSFDGEIK